MSPELNKQLLRKIPRSLKIPLCATLAASTMLGVYLSPPLGVGIGGSVEISDPTGGIRKIGVVLASNEKAISAGTPESVLTSLIDHGDKINLSCRQIEVGYARAIAYSIIDYEENAFTLRVKPVAGVIELTP